MQCRELLRVVRDLIEERGMAVIVSNKESTVWRKTSVKTSLREKQLKYTDLEELKVVTNDRHIAEQIKSDSTLSAQGNLLRSKVGNVAMDGVKTGKVGKQENCKIEEEMWSQSGERLCKSIIKGLARRNRERHAMLADVEEEQEQDVVCLDDVTGKKLPWHTVRKAHELELKYLRDFGVYEKSLMRKRPLKSAASLQWIRNWLTQTKSVPRREPMQIRSRMCAREFKSDDRPDLYAGTPPLEALKAIIAENNTSFFSQVFSKSFYQCQVNSRLVTILTSQVFLKNVFMNLVDRNLTEHQITQTLTLSRLDATS